MSLSLWSNPLVSWSLANCYDSWIVGFPLYLHPCLDMVLLEIPFTSYMETCGQQPLYVL